MVLDLYALAWVGLWQGLHAASLGRAVRATLLGVLALPWAAAVAGGACAGVAMALLDSRLEPGWLAAATSAGAFGAAFIGVVAVAVYSLGERLRDVAAQPLPHRPS